MTAGSGVHWEVEVSGFNLILSRSDHLTLPFSIVFHIAAALNVIYGWHEPKPGSIVVGCPMLGRRLRRFTRATFLALYLVGVDRCHVGVFDFGEWFNSIQTFGNELSRYSNIIWRVSFERGLLACFHDNGSLAFTRMELGDHGSLAGLYRISASRRRSLLNGWLQDCLSRVHSDRNCGALCLYYKARYLCIGERFPRNGHC